MNDYRDPLVAAQQRIDALQAEVETLRGHEVELPHPHIQRNPRRAWPLVVVLGIPTALFVGYASLVRRFHVGDGSVEVAAALLALPLLIVGCYGLAIPPRAPRRGAAYVAAGLGVLVFGLAWVALDPGGRRPDGWSSRLPRYPGRLVKAEACTETSGGATYETLRTGGKGKAPGTVSYSRALMEEELPSNRFQTSCPALGVDCVVYRAASLEIVECYTDKTHEIARVRYGTPACPVPRR